MIVIVTFPEDLSAAAVRDALLELGEEVFLIELEAGHEKYLFTYEADSTAATWSIRPRDNPDQCLTPEKISAVYWRRAVRSIGSRLLSLPTSDMLDDYEIFWSARWALEALPHDLFPLGHQLAFAGAENKHRQMETALKLGWRIPRTCHSNDKGKLTAFIATEEQIAVKALRIPAIVREGEEEKARHIACMSFASELLAEKVAAKERTQLCCQAAIRRTHDLRIMVFPGQTIAAEIDVRPLKNDKLDWRQHSLDLPHRIIPLDPAFDAELRSYLAMMGLKAGYFDFAVPEEGPPVFFECNTNAQWLWIEMVTGHPIAKAIAQELVRGSQPARGKK